LKIDRIELTHVRIPLVEPFRISSGAVADKDTIVVAVCADGLTGYGESSPMSGSFYSADTPELCWKELCTTVAPAVLGQEFHNPQEWNAVLDRLPAGNFTKTGVETALWDLAAKRAGQPLHRFLGGERDAVESGLAVGLYDEIPETLRVVDRYLCAGYKRVKLKIEPGRDVELIRAAREAFGDIPLFVDANGAYGPEHTEIFRRLDDFGLMMYEQPFPGDSLEALADLQCAVTTPICLDESLEDPARLNRAIELGSLRIANFKIQRIGGLSKALEMDAICRRCGIPAWVGTMPELGIGQAQGAALASLPNFCFPTDVEASARWFRDDLITPWLEVRDGMLALPEQPGIGYAVSSEALDRYRVAAAVFGENKTT